MRLNRFFLFSPGASFKLSMSKDDLTKRNKKHKKKTNLWHLLYNASETLLSICVTCGIVGNLHRPGSGREWWTCRSVVNKSYEVMSSPLKAKLFTCTTNTWKQLLNVTSKEQSSYDKVSCSKTYCVTTGTRTHNLLIRHTSAWVQCFKHSATTPQRVLKLHI